LVSGSAAAISTASEIAMPSEPVGWEAWLLPASVVSLGERITVAPQLSIIARL